MTPLLSIIIPTKNRYTYLESCLRSIAVHYNRSEVEIIITDNSTVKQEIEALKLFSNIKYSYTEKPISQVENFESALEKVTGKYVTMIGDDDGISDLLLVVVDYMVRKGINALNSPFVSYYWPDVISKNPINNFSSKLFLNNYQYNIVKIDAKVERDKCLSMGATSLCNLPKMYYGIIKKEILDKVKNETGYYFPGPSPDMANAFSVSHYASNFVYFDAPLFIAGNSAKSAAGMGLAGKHVGVIKDHPQLPSDCYLYWSKEVPEYWSGPTIWAESALQSIKKSSNKELIKQFNFPRLYASCLTFNPEYKEEIKYAIEKYNEENSSLFTFVKITFEFINIWLLRFSQLIKNISTRLNISKVTIKENVQNIEDACLIIKKYESRVIEMLENDY